MSSKSVINIQDIKATKKLHIVHDDLKDLRDILNSNLREIRVYSHYIFAKKVINSIKTEVHLLDRSIAEIGGKLENGDT